MSTPLGTPTVTPPLTIQWNDTAMWLVAAFVLAHALVRFNTPPTSRSSTTFRRFYVACGLYGVAVLVGWGTLTFLPPEVVTRFVPAWPKDLQGVAWPFATALVTTALVQVPGIAALDARIRAAFHQFARVTEEANALVQHLRRTLLVVPETLAARVRTAFETAGLDPDDAVFGRRLDARTLWTRVTALELIVADWEDSGPLQRFYSANRAEIVDLTTRHAVLALAARRTFAQLARLRREPADMTAPKLIAELEADIAGLSRAENAPAAATLKERIHRRLQLLGGLDGSDQTQTLGQEAMDIDTAFAQEVAKLERPLLRLVARGTLAAGRTPRVRTRLLRELGFPEATRIRDSLPDRLTGLFLVFFLWYPLQLVLRGGDPTERLLTGITIAAVYAAAILVAVYPKRWAFFQRQHVRPIRAYLVSAVMAVGVWAAAFAGLWSTISADGGEALRYLAIRWPWAVMTATTAFVTAWSADNGPRPGPAEDEPGRRLRWLETVGQAAATTVAAVIVIAMLRVTMGTPPTAPWLDARTYTIVTSAAVTGALIGYFVPSWHRISQQEREAIRQEAARVGSGGVELSSPPALAG